MANPTPQKLIRDLTSWAESREWIDWLELGGSFGRGAGDQLSDVDAAIGVADDEDLESCRKLAWAAMREYAPVAGTITQNIGESVQHLVVLYRDGRQLSLVAVSASFRAGLAPQAKALVDRSGRLATLLPADEWTPDEETIHEWGFLAWIALGDAARHAHRGHHWRSLRSLTESRDLAWQLWAARKGLVYPQFGSVTVENADTDVPPGIDQTHPAALRSAELFDAMEAMATVLRSLADTLPDAVGETVEERFRLLAPRTNDIM